MPTSFTGSLRKLRSLLFRFDPIAQNEKITLLRKLKTLSLPWGKALCQYHDMLLFCSVYADNNILLKLIAAELQRIATHLVRHDSRKDTLKNTGLPYTETLATFSYDLLNWMSQSRQYAIGLDSIDNDEALNDALRLTLPAVEKHLTTAEYSSSELFDALGISSEDRLSFLLTEFSKIALPSMRDFFLDRLGLSVRIFPNQKHFSRTFNRLPFVKCFIHDGLLKRFDHLALINSALPAPDALDSDQTEHVIRVIRYDLALLQRETDPATYLDRKSLRYYTLERGISVALYTMRPEYQLPLESYVGYTVFKNGFPVAYGGGWVFGRYALFGINIHESMRGGESGYLFCQLLRVYRQVFQVSYFEVEPYQFGKDNPEGIASGAYWFYYRYGFRSVDPRLRKLAEKEYRKFKTRPDYRSGKRTLLAFTQSNSALNLGTSVPPSVYALTEKITRMIHERYHGNRLQAIEDCVHKFKTRVDPAFEPNLEQQQAFIDIALLHQALKVRSKDKSRIFFEMAKTKPEDLYRYQELLLRLFDD